MTTTQPPTGFVPSSPEDGDGTTGPGWALGSAETHPTDRVEQVGGAAQPATAGSRYESRLGHLVHLSHLEHLAHLVHLGHWSHPASATPVSRPAGSTAPAPAGHTTNGHTTNGHTSVVQVTRPVQLERSDRSEEPVQVPPAPAPLPQPKPEATATRTSARLQPQHLGPTAAVVIATVVVLAGLGGWAAFNSFSSQGHSWETVPSGQPYYVKAIKQVVVPASIAKTAKAAAQARAAAAANPMVVTTPSTNVVLKVNPPPLGGRYAANGQVEDDFSPSYFAVPAGKTVHVTVLNYDTGYHTFTSPVLGLNVWLHPAKGNNPSKTSFTFKAPSTGYFWWLCDVPCDPYSMSRGGLMQGEIHAVKA